LGVIPENAERPTGSFTRQARAFVMPLFALQDSPDELKRAFFIFFNGNFYRSFGFFQKGFGFPPRSVGFFNQLSDFLFFSIRQSRNKCFTDF